MECCSIVDGLGREVLGEVCRQLKDVNLNGGRDLAMLQEHIAKNDLVGWSNPQCQRCGAPRPVQIILDSRTGRSVRVYKCQCGEHIWDDLRPNIS
jgi:hypothetical protein